MLSDWKGYGPDILKQPGENTDAAELLSPLNLIRDFDTPPHMQASMKFSNKGNNSE